MSNLNVDLEQLAAKIESWRQTKKTQNEKIPAAIWDEILAYHSKFPAQVAFHRRMGITATQLKNKLREVENENLFNDPAELCKIPNIPKHDPNNNTTPKYSAEHLHLNDDFSSLATIVVEFCRKDGCLMKIHTTTKNVHEIINSFLGELNVTNFS